MSMTRTILRAARRAKGLPSSPAAAESKGATGNRRKARLRRPAARRQLMHQRAVQARTASPKAAANA